MPTTAVTSNALPLGSHIQLPNFPRTFLGPKHTYRQADGAGNSILHPDIGRAGSSYARDVPSKHCFTSLPEPELVFDTLLKARGQQTHSGGTSSLAYAFGQLVTYSLFRTDLNNWTTNLTSSYLDLSPLYGIDTNSQDSVRDKASGRGLLYPDAFPEDRLAFCPPTTSALLVLFNRNHNYIAERLLSINERKRWIDPPPTDEGARNRQDEEIFQLAKLVNCGHFLGVMIYDYLPAILGLSEDNDWSRGGAIIEQFEKARKGLGGELSHGHHCSVELQTLYRLHALMSQADIGWTESRFNQLFGRKSFERITVDDVEDIVRQYGAGINTDPGKRTFADLTRGIDGKFSDDDLARILLDATENAAGAFRPRGIPAVVRAMEILCMEQARFWGVCSINEFRLFLGLKPFESFDEWCSEAVIASTARRLYGHIDNLELYTGLQCEASVLPDNIRPYSCGYTMAQAILAYSMRLIQGDRFYTIDLTPKNLTVWGYRDCQPEMPQANMGSHMSRLLMRHLQRHYSYNTAYGWFPFITPQRMREYLTKQGIADRYEFDRPLAMPLPKILDELSSIRYVANDPERFPLSADIKVVQDDGELMLTVEKGIKTNSLDKSWALEALLPNKDAMHKHGQWFSESLLRKITERKWKYGGVKGTYVDIVWDVINASVVHWVAEHLFGLPLKTDGHPEGLYTENELYDILTKLYSLKFPSTESPDCAFSLRQSAIQSSHAILTLIERELLPFKQVLSPKAFVDKLTSFREQKRNEAQKPNYQFMNKLNSTGKSMDEMINTILDIAISCSVNVAQAAVHAVDFFLDEEQEKERHHILELMQLDDAESGDLLLGYAREALRFNPRICGSWREVAADAQIPQGQDLSPLNVRASDRIWISFKNANLDPAQFPEPMEIDPRRPRTAYRIFGNEFFSGPIAAFGEQIIVETLRVILKLKNVRRAESYLGRLSGFRTLVNETELNVYLLPDGTTSPWPGPMHLVVSSL
ncbi:hypothetical protein AMATHDRAFT_187988 [Amanita thiersii Skay4041]|uniref:Heme peroxidase n=1 Tax=Amanita thiersii Skay4041 TaxID=703135 RepID=A0A2A9NTC1_9AGAR|nr:hypothetical protein AMATHDRAFT_187988 [Amanita thiersii Skay4041]